MERGDKVVVKSGDEFFYNMKGEISGINPSQKWSICVKFDKPPYNSANGYWFSKSDVVVIKEGKKNGNV